VLKKINQNIQKSNV
jgi:Sperm-tail PG-rich repeat